MYYRALFILLVGPAAGTRSEAFLDGWEPIRVFNSLYLAHVFDLNSMHDLDIMAKTLNVIYWVVVVTALEGGVLWIHVVQILSCHSPWARVKGEVRFFQNILIVGALSSHYRIFVPVGSIGLRIVLHGLGRMVISRVVKIAFIAFVDFYIGPLCPSASNNISSWICRIVSLILQALSRITSLSCCSWPALLITNHGSSPTRCYRSLCVASIIVDVAKGHIVLCFNVVVCVLVDYLNLDVDTPCCNLCVSPVVPWWLFLLDDHVIGEIQILIVGFDYISCCVFESLSALFHSRIIIILVDTSLTISSIRLIWIYLALRVTIDIFVVNIPPTCPLDLLKFPPRSACHGRLIGSGLSCLIALFLWGPCSRHRPSSR